MQPQTPSCAATSRQTGRATSTLARQAGVSRAALYRSYPHVKEEFERRLAALRAGGTAPDPRDAQITRLKAQNDELSQRVADRDAAIRELEQFRALAISRLAAQHGEIGRLRRQAIPATAPVPSGPHAGDPPVPGTRRGALPGSRRA